VSQIRTVVGNTKKRRKRRDCKIEKRNKTFLAEEQEREKEYKDKEKIQFA
jgi:hypothetical protein